MDLPKARSLLRSVGKRPHLFGCRARATSEEHDCTCGKHFTDSLILDALKCLEPEIPDNNQMMDFREKVFGSDEVNRSPANVIKKLHSMIFRYRRTVDEVENQKEYVVTVRDICTAVNLAWGIYCTDEHEKCLGSDEDNSYEAHVRLHKQLEERHPLNRIASALEKIVGINLFKPGLRPDSPSKKPGADSLKPSREKTFKESVRRYKIRNIRDEVEHRAETTEYRRPTTNHLYVIMYDPITQLRVELHNTNGEEMDALGRRALQLLAERVLEYQEKSDG